MKILGLLLMVIFCHTHAPRALALLGNILKLYHCTAGGFNQPIMCGGEPRQMLKKDRGKADSPIYTIQMRVPKHGFVNIQISLFGIILSPQKHS